MCQLILQQISCAGGKCIFYVCQVFMAAEIYLITLFKQQNATARNKTLYIHDVHSLQNSLRKGCIKVVKTHVCEVNSPP